jgi:poly(A) polymerase
MSEIENWNQANRIFALEVARAIRDRNHIAYFAGGCVRDQLLGNIPKDYDVATDASPEQILQIFGRRNTLLVGAEFGVACVHRRIDGESFNVEVATFRSDGPYLDGRRPSHIKASTPEIDAQRRDFTINGMFYDPLENCIIDYVGGRADIDARLIRAIGDPSMRIDEDKLRMVRAVRFAARFGFDIELQTEAAIRASAASLQVVSSERLHDELRKICTVRSASSAIKRLYNFGLLDTIWPALSQHWQTHEPSMEAVLTAIDRLKSHRIEKVLAIFVYDMITHNQTSQSDAVIEELALHLKFSNDAKRTMMYLAGNINQVFQSKSLAWSTLQPRAIHADVEDLIDVCEAIGAIDGDLLDGVENFSDRRKARLQNLDPPALLTGNDLQKLGYTPGPIFKDMLEAVRAAQLNDMLTTYDDAILFVAERFRAN